MTQQEFETGNQHWLSLPVDDTATVMEAIARGEYPGLELDLDALATTDNKGVVSYRFSSGKIPVRTSGEEAQASLNRLKQEFNNGSDDAAAAAALWAILNSNDEEE